MEWTEKIKATVGKYVLDQKIRDLKRATRVCNLTDAKNIGIIYNATELTSFDLIRDFTRKIATEKARISILGYVHSKQLVDHYLYRKGFDFFYKGNLNWYYRPVSDVTDKFIAEPFDILINLSLEDYYPIRYITALSPAGFKAGKYAPDDQYLDLMIDIEKEKNQMRKLQVEIRGGQDEKKQKRALDEDMEKRSQAELQLSFLINQLLHYLSIIKKN